MRTVRLSLALLAFAMIASLLLGACQSPAPTAAPASTQAPAAAKAAEPTKASQPTAAPASASSSQPLIFLASQLGPVEEQEKMRNVILKNFTGGKADFIADANENVILDRVLAEAKAGKVNSSVIGALHGAFPNLITNNALEDLTPLAEKLKDRPIVKEYMALGKMGTDKQYRLGK